MAIGENGMGKIGGLIFGALVWYFSAGVAVQPAHAQFNEMACIELSELQTGDSPRLLARSVRDCIAQERYDDAMRLFLGYSAYGTFDQQRVRDESGHAAFVELNSWIFGGYRRAVLDELKLVSARLREGGAFFADTCAAIRAVGWPEYRPTYMIERGIVPRKTDDDWVRDGFAAAAAWEMALVEVNGCPAG